MPNSYHDMTGVLKLKAITPVITALFGGYSLDASYPGAGVGEIYIASQSEGSDVSWDSVLEKLRDLAAANGIVIEKCVQSCDEEGSAEDVLVAIGRHFGVERNADFMGLLESYSFVDDSPLDVLFDLAQFFDDGHGLTAIKTEAAWTCSKRRLFEFGGCGSFIGTRVCLSGSSDQFAGLGDVVQTALEANDTDKAADAFARHLKHLIDGIQDDTARTAVARRIAETITA
jgi:hypothetical protein